MKNRFSIIKETVNDKGEKVFAEVKSDLGKYMGNSYDVGYTHQDIGVNGDILCEYTVYKHDILRQPDIYENVGVDGNRIYPVSYKKSPNDAWIEAQKEIKEEMKEYIDGCRDALHKVLSMLDDIETDFNKDIAYAKPKKSLAKKILDYKWDFDIEVQHLEHYTHWILRYCDKRYHQAQSFGMIKKETMDDFFADED